MADPMPGAMSERQGGEHTSHTAPHASDAQRAHFEELANHWDARQRPDRDEALRAMLAPFAPAIADAGDILEVGSGTGALIPHLRRCAPAARIVSIDLAHNMLVRARRRAGVGAVVQADVHCLPFGCPAQASPFDLIVCHNVFPHFVDMAAALRELARVLPAGGQLLILHDLSRQRVNAIHGAGGPAIKNDLLPAADVTRHLLTVAGFGDVWVEDAIDGYAATGHRRDEPSSG